MLTFNLNLFWRQKSTKTVSIQIATKHFKSPEENRFISPNSQTVYTTNVCCTLHHFEMVHVDLNRHKSLQVAIVNCHIAKPFTQLKRTVSNHFEILQIVLKQFKSICVAKYRHKAPESTSGRQGPI